MPSPRRARATRRARARRPRPSARARAARRPRRRDRRACRARRGRTPGRSRPALALQAEEVLDVDRRVHDLRRAPVVALDALGDVAGVGDEHVRAGGAGEILRGAAAPAAAAAAAASPARPPRPRGSPPPRRSASACGSSRRAAPPAGVRTFLAHAWLLESTRSKPDEVERAERAVHQRQQLRVVARGARDAVQERGVDGSLGDLRRPRRGVIDRREQLGLREHLQQLQHDLLGAARDRQPVVDDRDARKARAQLLELGRRRRRAAAPPS